MRLTGRDFLLLIIILYFTFVGGTFYSQFNFSLRIVNHLIVSIILLSWLLLKISKGQGLPRTTLDRGIALYLLINVASAAFGQSPRFSFEMLWFTVTHTLAFYLLVDFMRRGWTQKLVWAFYMASAVVCVVGLTEFLAWYVGTSLFGRFSQGWLDIGGWRNPIPPTIYRLNITLNGSTPLASYLALLIPPAVGLILTLPRRSENRRALIVWLMLALPVQILTFSRAGILALTVSLTLLGFGWLALGQRRWHDLLNYWQKSSPFMRAGAVVLTIFFGGLLFLWLQRSFSGRVYSTNFRLTLWSAAMSIFRENWLTGVGPSNFGRALLRLNQADLPRAQIASAHSLYFDTAAQLGLAGLVAGGLLFFLIGWSWLRHWHQLSSNKKRLLLISVGASLVGLATQLLVDDYSATPNLLLILALLAYVVMAVQPVARQQYRRYPSYIAAVVIIVYLAWLGRIALADWWFQTSFAAENRGNLAEAVSYARRSQRLDPGLALRHFRIGLLQARLAYSTNDSTHLELAVRQYQLGMAQEPILGLNSANLAGLLWQQHRQAEAMAMMKKTIAAEANPTYRLNLGYFYEQQGDWSSATKTYGQLLSRAPHLAGSGFWQAEPARAAHWPAIVEQATQATRDGQAASQTTTLDLALAREDWGTVAQLVEQGSLADHANFRAAAIELYLARNLLPDAEKLINPEPESSEEHIWLGRLKLQQGEPDQAEKYLKSAVFLGNRDAYYYLGQLYERKKQTPAAKTAYQQGFVISAPENVAATIYGRFGGNALAPQLIQISDARQLRSALALARLYMLENRDQDADRIYRLVRQIASFYDVESER